MSFKPRSRSGTRPGKSAVYWWPDDPTLSQLHQHPGPPPAEDGRVCDRTVALGARPASKNSLITSKFTQHPESPLILDIFTAYGIARFRAGGRQLPFQILQLRMCPPIAIIIHCYLSGSRSGSGTRTPGSLGLCAGP